MLLNSLAIRLGSSGVRGGIGGVPLDSHETNSIQDFCSLLLTGM